MIDCTLHDNIQMQKVIEVAINLDDVGMIEIALNFYLSAELLYHIFISYVLLGQNFYGTDKAAFSL